MLIFTDEDGGIENSNVFDRINPSLRVIYPNSLFDELGKDVIEKELSQECDRPMHFEGIENGWIIFKDNVIDIDYKEMLKETQGKE